MSEPICAPIAIANAHALPGLFRTTSFDHRQVTSCRHPEGEVAPQKTIAQAYDRGFCDGHSRAVADFAAERSRLLALVSTATALELEPSDELAAMMVDAVVRLARAAVGNAVIDHDWLVERAYEAAAIISQCDAAQTLWVNPDDVSTLEGAGLPLAIHADPDAAPGSIRIGCSSGWIEHGVPLYLEQLQAATTIERPAR
jgi:flagellar assembly protein FliH